MGGTIFISYRRGADSGFAGRLYDRLVPSFGRERVFMDVDSIDPGADFVVVLQAWVAQCDVLLALIGRGWIAAADTAEQRRLDNPDDFVRIEIAAALAQGKRVIPVVIDDVSFPRGEELPEEIKSLARRHAVRVRNDRFRDDAERLIQALEKSLADAEAARQAEEEARLQSARERQRAAEEARQHAEAEAARKAEEERQRAASEAKRQAEDRERRRAEEKARLKVAEANGRAEFVVFIDIHAPWCPEMVALPAGEFLMGSPEGEEGRFAEPQHRVTIGTRFAIGRFPVTFDEFDYFCDATKREKPEDRGWGRRRRPVINVSWGDTQAYVEWLANETGKPYRLPSEAEWVYACRAGTTTRYAFGNTISKSKANFAGGFFAALFSSIGPTIGTTVVGSFPQNPWGLRDMHGNVWEWVEDVWHDSYEGAPVDGSAWTDGEGKDSSRIRVVRGGSWNDDPRDLRSADRSRSEPDFRCGNLGFRVARTLD